MAFYGSDQNLNTMPTICNEDKKIMPNSDQNRKKSTCEPNRNIIFYTLTQNFKICT
jgi:hypothetical protein